MNVGFTGTQRGMTEAQWASYWRVIYAIARDNNHVCSFHQGDCIGADAQAAHGAKSLLYRIIGHPPDNDSKRAFFHADEWRAPLPYLDRNKAIVRSSEKMIATPGETQEQLRSGTWSTIRFARRISKPLSIIYPDGTVFPA